MFTGDSRGSVYQWDTSSLTPWKRLKFPLMERVNCMVVSTSGDNLVVAGDGEGYSLI